MPLDEADLKLMWDMLDAARRVVSYVQGRSEAEYRQNRMLSDAVERCVEIVGEAARNVSESGRARLPAVPWSVVVGTRHIIAHDYGEIDPAKMWRIATIHVPALIGHLEAALNANPPGPEAHKNPAEP
jgi:uncharacterized protein with HEPN domain